MERRTLGMHICDLLSGIKLCYENELQTQSLILIYSTIDILAWLSLPDGRQKVEPDDFVHWTESYLLPGSGLSVTGPDLYGARCGLLHTYRAWSNLSSKGAATKITYTTATNPTQEKEFQNSLKKAGCNAKVVQVEKLFTALKTGIARFLKEVQGDRHRNEVAEERARFFFVHISKPSLRQVPSEDTLL